MSTPRTIILASTSEARKQLLTQTGLSFIAEASEYEEDMTLNVPPEELVTILSQGKARAVAGKHTDAIVIGADSIVALDGKVLGKPQDATEATKMLKYISGKTHMFLTGFTIIDTASGKEVTRVATTSVQFKQLTDEEIQSYLETTEFTKHAAGYAVQDKGVMFIEHVEGGYTSIVGLPLDQLFSTLKEFGVNILFR